MNTLIKNITRRIRKKFNRKDAKAQSKTTSAPSRLQGLSFFSPRLCVSAVSLFSKLSLRLCASAVLFFLFFQIGAQTTYPIRTYTVLNPPMPYILSAFASEPGRMQLNVVVDDVALDQYAVKFSLHIQGNGVHLYTKPDIQQQPFMLDGGLTETITGLDLEPLFNPNNLIFEGYSRNEYQRNGRLPEGVYRVWVDVLDYYRGFKVSQAFPGMAMIYLTRAPRLSFPLNKAEVNPQTEPNIRFSWMGTLPTDPQADVYYRFNLWEILPEGRDPYEVARVSSPVFTEESDDPNFLYDMGMPPLMDGMSYAWQVRAVDRENRARFQNEGLSEVNVFRYGLSCVTPEARINSVAYTEAAISWPAHVASQLYRVFYKKAKDTEWQSEETTMVSHTLKGLEDNTDYEIKVVAICGNQESDESRIIRLKTDRNVDYTCGTDNDDFDLSNREPLESLQPFDEFKAADFVIEVTEAEGSNGLFSGKGLALVPYLGMVKFRVEFDGITINTDNRMVDGEVHFVYDEATGLVVGIGAGGGGDNGDDADVTEDLGDIADEVIKIDGDVKDVKVDGDKVVVVKEDGTTETMKVKKGDKVAVVSNGGQVHVADSGSGRVYTTPKKKSGGKKGSDSVGTASQTGEYGASVTFKVPNTMRFGYDPVGDGKTKPNAYFETNKTGDRIAWKSIQAGGTDYIDVIPQGTHADSLRYIRESGLVTPVTPQEKGSRLLLTGLGGGDEDILTVAVAKTEQIDSVNSREILTEAGALGLVSYDVITKNVVLVPVNGAQCPQNPAPVIQELDRLYKGAITNWQVEIADNLVVDDLSADFGDTGTDFARRFTNDMNRVIKAFKRVHNKKRKTLYLFFVNDAKPGKLGYMPLAGDYGFIFNFGANLNTVAHELGHGGFNLRHTFSDKAQHYLSERSTKNLMDYSNGSELWKYQWDLIHNPELIIFDAYDEEEGAYIYEFLGKKYEILFDKVYSNNYTLNTEYFDKIQGGETNNFPPEFTDDELKELTDEEKAWIKRWEIRARKSNDVLLDVIDAIQKASGGEKISKIVAQQDKVYIIKCKFDGYDFNVAVYGHGEATTLNKIFTKVVVGKIDDLFLEENQKHLYVDINKGRDYWIMALFEEGKKEPSLMMQISGKYNVLAANKWLKFLGVLDETKVGLPGIELTHEDKVIRNGDFLYINKTPCMPQLKARITDESISTTSLSFKTKYNVKYSYSGKTYTFNDKEYPKTVELKSGKVHNISFEKVRGGTLEIQNGDNKITLHIRGENPTEAEVMSYFSLKGASKYWFIKGVTMQESGCKQFNYINKSLSLAPVNEDKVYPGPFSSSEGQKGLPLYGGPRGFGLKQLDNWRSGGINKTCSAEQRWNWKSNIDGGLEVIETKVNSIKATNGSHKKWFDKITEWNKSNPDSKVEPLSDLTLGGTIFTYASSPLFDWDYGKLTDGKKSFLDANLIKSFNGHYVIRLIIPDQYEENGQTITPAPYWKVVEERKDYVIKVLSKNK